MKNSKWCDSVTLPKVMGEINSEKHRKFMIKAGLMDETITRADPQVTYAGCDTRDIYYHGWDVSN